MSSLKYVKEVSKRFGIKGNKELHERGRQAYVTAQVQEQKAIINRLIIDAAVTEAAIADAKDDNTRSAYQSKLSNYESDLRQLTKTLDFFLKLEEELGKGDDEHPSSF